MRSPQVGLMRWLRNADLESNTARSLEYELTAVAAIGEVAADLDRSVFSGRLR